MISEALPKNQKYWTVADWTAQGLMPWSVTWTNCQVDHLRIKEGRAFASKAEADLYLSKQEEVVA